MQISKNERKNTFTQEMTPEQKVEYWRRRCGELFSENENIRKECDILNCSHASLLRQYYLVSEENAKLQADQEQFEQEMQKLKEEKVSLQMEADDALSSLQDLREQMDEAHSECKELLADCLFYKGQAQAYEFALDKLCRKE